MSIEHKVRDLFSDSEFVGNVIRYSTFLEFDLDCVLCQYFIREDRIDDGLDLLLSEFTFGRKIGLLTNLPIRKSLISYQRSISGLRRFQRIRNLVAHDWTINISKVRKLLECKQYDDLLIDYPDGMKRAFRVTRRALCRLIRVKEFKNPHKPSGIQRLSIMLDRIMKG